MHAAYSHCRPGVSREAVDVRAIMRTCMTGERPPTGLWKWADVTVEIAFFYDNKAGGGGTDDIGDYYISGTWGREGVKFIIHYVLKYDITFEGAYADGKVTGTCVKGSDGSKLKFELVYCGKDANVTPRSGQWSGHMLMAGANKQIQIDLEFGAPPYKTISGRGKDDNGNFRIKGRLDGRALRLLRQNVVYYGVMNEAGTEAVGMFLDTGRCWTEGRFVLKIGGTTASPSGSEDPNSGVWFWFLSGRPDYHCYLQLMFGPGKVSGSGRDETGYFTLTGSWSGTSITFTKSTTSVTYTGTFSPGCNIITGQSPDGGTFDIAFFMEFEIPDFPYQFPKKDLSSGQQCAIKLYQEIQIWLTRRRLVIQEFKNLVQKIQQAQSGGLSAKFEGDITDADQLIIVAVSLLALLSGGGAAGALLRLFGGSSGAVSFTGQTFTASCKILEQYKSTADAETLKDLVEEDVISSRIIYYLIDTLWDISGVLSAQCAVDISVRRITKGLLFQAATGIDIISFAFPGENAAPMCTAPEYDHGKLHEIEESLFECIGIIMEMHKEAEARVGGVVGLVVQLNGIQEALQDLGGGSAAVMRKCLERCLELLEQKMTPYISLQQRTDLYIKQRELLGSKLSVETRVTVEFINEMVGILKDINPDWCQAVEDAGLQDVLAITMSKVYPAIKQKVNFMFSSYDPSAQDAPVEILDIVVVGEAIVGLPAINRNLLLAVPTLQDVVLYEPYGCSIDQSTILGIASGLINPNCRQMESADTQIPESWNSLLAGQSEELPSVYLEQTCISEVAFTELKHLLSQFPESVQRNRVIIPFFSASESDSLPPVPLWLLSSACSVAGMVTGINVRVHLATSLRVPDPTPQLQTMCQSQYSFSQSRMRCDVAQLHMEGINQTWLNQFIHNDELSLCFSSSTTHSRNMTFEGGVIRITTTTTTTYEG